MEIVERYLEHLRLEHRPHDSVYCAGCIVKKWAAYAGETGGDRATVLKYLDQWQNPRTRAGYWVHIRNYVRWLVAEGLVEADWTLKVKIKARRVCRHDTLAREEIEAMLAVCGDSWLGRRNFTIITLLWQTGARRDEIRRLRVSDMDLSLSQFRARIKGGDIGVFHLTPRALEAVEAWIPRVEGAYLFRGAGRKLDRPISRNSFADMLKDVAKKAKVKSKVHPHAFRHTVGQEVYDKTNRLDVVQAVLHHKSLASTQIYAHLAERKAAAALDAVMGDGPPGHGKKAA